MSSTTSYLSRTNIFGRYEQQLRRLLSELQQNAANPDEIEIIRKEIITLRKSLRSQGHDLSLGTLFISFQGFRNDSSMGSGFKRLVIHITEQRIFYICGQENHIELAEFLEKKIGPMVRGTKCILRSYLWYAWKGNTLILSGSDTETKENFERLKAFGEVNTLFMLKWLKSLP